MKKGVILLEDRLHKIRFANKDDIQGIMTFIRNYWNKNHIFANSVEFFKYEHMDSDRINFLVAVNLKNSDIEGILGFIKYTKEYENSDIWNVMWKVKERTGDQFLGVKLLTFLVEKANFRTVSSVGLNEKTLPIYRYLGYKVGKLQHYYMLNDKIKDFKIAVVKNRNVKKDIKSAYRYKLVKIETMPQLKKIFNFEKYKERTPYKDQWYINKRYFQHPVYQYNVFGIKRPDGIDSIIISREIEMGGAKVLRIVDYIGLDNDLEGISEDLNQLIQQNNYEYIDFYTYGIEEGILKKIGFDLRHDDDKNIIPNYFEPFEQKNINLDFFTTEKGKLYVFKADGDQDRPNL